jgi:protein-L-isoaspartate(D-aspartate) O-methyltransferase
VDLTRECPECGFDIPEGGPCPVCAASLRPARRGRKRRSAVVLLTAAGALVVAAAVVAEIDFAARRTPPTAAATAPVLAAAPPISNPAPSTVEAVVDPAAVLGIDLQREDVRAIVLNESRQSFNLAARVPGPPTTSRAAYLSWMLAHTDQKEKFLVQKWDLAQKMLGSGSLSTQRVLQAFLRTPREFFARDTRRAYDDAVLPIGYGQTISGPQMVSRMTENLDPQPSQKVLEIGTGSGYQSAFLSQLTTHVYSVEIVPVLARETDAIYRKHTEAHPEFGNISRKIDDGYDGWPEHAPYDRIIVTCGIDHVPPELLRELAPDGVMVIPVGPPSGQTILRITKHVAADGTVTLDRQDIFKGKRKEIFVPFTSRDGGSHKQ